MWRRALLVLAPVAALLAGCSDYGRAERPPWRAEAERACLAKGLVHESASIRAAPELVGPGVCGATRPFKVTALLDGAVAFSGPQTLDCPMIAELEAWLREVVQPAAQARFGEPVVRVNSMGSYSCRGINNMSGASLSEHAFANALDVGGFVLASGRELNIMRGFNGADEQERAFLHEVHAGACPHFTTVLGPGYNAFHYNHIHVDLAMHGQTSRGPRRYCKPVPKTDLPAPPARDDLPDAPPIEEEMDIARAPAPAPALRLGPPSLMAAMSPAPAVPVRRAASTIAPRPPAVEPPAPVEAPLISFAEPEPPRAIPPALRPRPALPVEPDLAALARRRPARSPPEDAGPSREGVPGDWDATSSIPR